MSILRFCNFSYLIYLFALSLMFPLVGCSGGDGGASGSSPALSWVAPSEREDGTALSLSEIASFRIYYGTESGSYSDTISIDDPSATQTVFVGVPSGSYFAVMTSIDIYGRESSFSAPEIEVTF